MRFWDLLATGYRNGRALGAALLMFVAIISMLSLRCNPVVDRQEILGLVVEIEAEGVRLGESGESMTRTIVATPDSVDIRLLLPGAVPRPGDFVPLIAERHKKGNTEYYPDIQKWRLEGPQ